MYLRKRKKKGEGFTLIELLIVIVIIGILISIALPNFKAAQDRAKNASLESNMRTLSVIAQTYSVDWGGNVADNVTILHNEATTKNYWKDLKNPFTGQSGLGFAISNYSQAVSLISFLQGVKLAESVEYLKKEQAIIDTEKTVTDSSQTATSSGGIAAQDVFGETAGMAAYLSDNEQGEFLVTGSVPLKVGKGVDFLKDSNGKIFTLASSNKNKIAVKNSYSSSGNYPLFLAKMVDALPQGWKDWIDKHKANWWENEGKTQTIERIKDAKERLVNAVANFTDDQKADFDKKYTAFQDSMNKVKDFQTSNMEKLVEFDNLNKETRFKSMDMELQISKMRNKIMAKVGDYGTLYKTISSSCGWNGGTYEQNACDTASKEWNTYWDKVNKETANNADLQKMEDERNNMWNDFYNSDTYRNAESKMREEVWNKQDQLFNEAYNAQNNLQNMANNTGNYDSFRAANDITWGGYELNWNDSYQKAGGDSSREVDVAMKAVYIHEEEKTTGIDYLSEYNKK